MLVSRYACMFSNPDNKNIQSAKSVLVLHWIKYTSIIFGGAEVNMGIRCFKCNKIKLEEDMTAIKKKLGCNYICNNCIEESTVTGRRKIRRRKEKVKRENMRDFRKCDRCKVTKNIDEFDNRNSVCKECIALIEKEREEALLGNKKISYWKTESGRIVLAKSKELRKNYKDIAHNEYFKGATKHHYIDDGYMWIYLQIHRACFCPNKEIHRKRVLRYFNGSIDNMRNNNPIYNWRCIIRDSKRKKRFRENI